MSTGTGFWYTLFSGGVKRVRMSCIPDKGVNSSLPSPVINQRSTVVCGITTMPTGIPRGYVKLTSR